jgi:hypothetical protein
MPTKSKRNRRKVPQVRKASDLYGSSLVTNQDIANLSINIPTPLTEKPSMIANHEYKEYLFSEIKWIGIVTAIIIVLLAISYILFH